MAIVEQREYPHFEYQNPECGADELGVASEAETDCAFADVAPCRSCGDRVRQPGWCRDCRRRLLGGLDVD